MSEYIKRFFNRRVSPRFFVFVYDTLLIVLSFIIASFFHFGLEGMLDKVSIDTFIVISIIVFANWASFIAFKTFWGVLRFSAFSDITRIVLALSVGYLISFFTLVTFRELNIIYQFSHTVFFGAYILNTMLMSLSRVIVKEIYDATNLKPKKSIPTMIYGTKEGGVSLAKAIKTDRASHFDLLGFITDDDNMIGKKLMGVNVYGKGDSLFSFIRNKGVKKVIVSTHKMQSQNTPAFLESLVDCHVSLLVSSPLSEWDGGTTPTQNLKDVQIEDLLPRSPIQVNMREIANNIEGKRVLITGAAGSIGSEIVRQVAAFNPYQIILVDQAETPLHDMYLELQKEWINISTEIVVADICNEKRMRQVFSVSKPHYIFHAAAYKHVPMMEANVSESIQNNVLGVKVIADLAVEFGAKKFVMVSTDKAVNPSNVMGCSKRIGEIYVQSYAKYLESKDSVTTQFITTRFGNVLGSNGSVIPLFREQIKRGGPVTVTHPEIIRYFMTITEACQLVLEAGSMGNGGEIYIFDMGKPVKIVDLAKRMILLSGAKNLKIEYTGLRHGEKLYEELLNNEENVTKTHHEKIMIANVRYYDFDAVKSDIDSLIELSYRFDEMAIVSKMKQMVPEFKSLNSKFATLDN